MLSAPGSFSPRWQQQYYLKITLMRSLNVHYYNAMVFLMTFPEQLHGYFLMMQAMLQDKKLGWMAVLI